MGSSSRLLHGASCGTQAFSTQECCCLELVIWDAKCYGTKRMFTGQSFWDEGQPSALDFVQLHTLLVLVIEIIKP